MLTVELFTNERAFLTKQEEKKKTSMHIIFIPLIIKANRLHPVSQNYLNSFLKKFNTIIDERR